jgi:hypothetical protein
MPRKDLDPVEWELVRADIAMEKARLKANGDWAKWEEFQAQTNSRFAAHVESASRMARSAREGRPETEEDRAAWWWSVRTPDFSFLFPPRKHRRRGWPLR